MQQLIPELSAWLNGSWKTIVSLCFLVYILFTIRFLIYWFSLYRVKRWSDLPMQVTVPKDVYLGIGLSVFIACTCISLTIILQDFSLPTAIVILAIDIFIIFAAVSALAMPLRAYRLARREMEESVKRQKQNQNITLEDSK